MTDTISLTGVVATTPRHVTTTEGLDITSFRLASSQRRFDRKSQTWVDMGTNWYTITAFRHLASNLAASIQKGDRIVAAGRLRVREWEKGDRSGTTVEVEAETVGHDLTWGHAAFTKSLATDPGSTNGSGGAGGGGGGVNERGYPSAPHERSNAGSPFTGDEWAVPGAVAPAAEQSDPYLPADSVA